MIFHRCLFKQDVVLLVWHVSCEECSFTTSCETLALAEREAISHFWRGRKAA